jgi:tetratricopeptide (TPR) repeat protein
MWRIGAQSGLACEYERVPNDQYSEPTAPGVPSGDAYEWYHRARLLLEQGNADAAIQLLERVRTLEPRSMSVLETYARALFDAKHFRQSAAAFEQLAASSPDNDYAHFGLGMSLWRLQEFTQARDELAMAMVMRPSRSEYATALSQVKATLRARSEAGIALNGPLGSHEGFGEPYPKFP